MVLAIILIVLTVLCILFLLPLRIKGSFGDGAWSVSVHYAFIRVFHKESPPPMPPAETPPLPDVGQDTPPEPSEISFEELPDEPEPEPMQEEQTEPAQEAAETPEPASIQEAVPESVSQTAETQAPAPESAAADIPEPAEESAAEKPPEKPKKKNFIRRYIDRLKPHSLHDILALVKDGCTSLSPSLKFFMRHLHFRHMKIYLAVATDDAAKTAKLYGEISAGAFNLLGALGCWLDIQTDEMRILADFFNEKMTFRASGELRCSPAALLLTALILGFRFLRRTRRRFRAEDKEAARYERETAPLPQT